MSTLLSSLKAKACSLHRQRPNLSKFFLLVSVSGGGYLAYSGAESLYHHYKDKDVDPSQRKRVVVLGTGWAGTNFLRHVDSSQYDVQVISPRNYFAFTPLLPNVTTGTVEARSIVEPIRNIILKKHGSVGFLEAECYKIDPKNKKVHCRGALDKLGGKEEFIVDYDYLVVAMGARANTFGTPGVEEHTHFLKEVEDAQKIRRSVLDCFERASLPNLSEEEKKKNLHFVVVGGGPTGVEFAAELHDFIEEDLSRLYPAVKDMVKITLLEAADHILSVFDKRITEFAETKFQRDGINLKLGSMVTKVTDKDIWTKERSGQESCTPYGMVVWSTGIGTRPVVTNFMKEIGQTNRRVLATDEWLRVEGCDSIYALGDCATINQRKVMDDVAAIFKKADKDNTGTLKVDELEKVVKDICERYPQLKLYMEDKGMKKIAALLKESKGDETKEVNIERFKEALSAVDSKMKNLPATAQVAYQQGEYLAKCFNRMKQCEESPEGPLRFRETGRHRFHPFRYKHFGQFAPLGGDQTAAQLPFDKVWIGYSSQWLWYSAYACYQVSWRNRLLVMSDWARRYVHGRDASGL